MHAFAVHGFLGLFLIDVWIQIDTLTPTPWQCCIYMAYMPVIFISDMFRACQGKKVKNWIFTMCNRRPLASKHASGDATRIKLLPG